MFRPWLQVEWFRKITNYQKKLVYFQKFSDEVMDGVMIFSFQYYLDLTHSLNFFFFLSFILSFSMCYFIFFLLFCSLSIMLCRYSCWKFHSRQIIYLVWSRDRSHWYFYLQMPRSSGADGTGDGDWKVCVFFLSLSSSLFNKIVNYAAPLSVFCELPVLLDCR